MEHSLFKVSIQYIYICTYIRRVCVCVCVCSAFSWIRISVMNEQNGLVTQFRHFFLFTRTQN